MDPVTAWNNKMKIFTGRAVAQHNDAENQCGSGSNNIWVNVSHNLELERLRSEMQNNVCPNHASTSSSSANADIFKGRDWVHTVPRNWLTLGAHKEEEDEVAGHEEEEMLRPALQIGERRSSNNMVSSKRSRHSYFSDHLPEDVIQDILCRLPICNILEAQSVCRSWKAMIGSNESFRELFDEQNKEEWLVMQHRSQCDGIALFNLGQRRWLKTFHHNAGRSTSPWLLRAAAGGLAVFSQKDIGHLDVINPLTKYLRCLPDVRVNSRVLLSEYLKKKECDLIVELVYDSISKTYKVILLGNFRARKMQILIYSSTRHCWQAIIPNPSMNIWTARVPRTAVYNETVYCLSMDGQLLVSYEVGRDSIQRRHISKHRIMKGEAAGDWINAAPGRGLGILYPPGNRLIGLVVYKGGRIIMLSNMTRRTYCPVARAIREMPTNLGALWELMVDRAPGIVSKWKLLRIVPLDLLQADSASTSCSQGDFTVCYDGGDCIWIIQLTHASRMMSFNVETKEIKLWPGFPAESIDDLHIKPFWMPLRFSALP